jgi:hypothetical protein
MAEYYTLLMRAVEGLPNRTQTARRAVYDRARAALINQLRSLDPPVSESEIVRERLALDEAIRLIETELHATAETENASGNSEPIKKSGLKHERSQLKPATSFPEARPYPPVGSPGTTKTSFNPSDDIEESEEELAAQFPENDVREGTQQERPRIDIIANRQESRRSLRSILLTSSLVAVIASIAVSAWILRDKPSAPLLTPSSGLLAQQEPKFSGRIGEDRPTTATLSPSQSSSHSSPQAISGAQTQALAIAQRAMLFEENAADLRVPKITQGRTLWRLEPMNGAQGQPLEQVVRAQMTIPETGLSLTLTLRRNLDAALPASHTVELDFSSDGGRIIRDVGLLQLKTDEGSLGSPLSGLPVPVKDNLFLIGLSSLSADQERNKSLLLQRNWVDIPIRFASGQRAVVSLEKGTSGDTALNEAFRQWAK